MIYPLIFSLTLSTFCAPASADRLEAEAREILDQLLRIDTSEGNETVALAPIAERFRRAGIEVQQLESSPGRGNLIARLHGAGRARPLLLLAHVDVVPVKGQSWTTPAFQPTERDGFLYARGVGDDKSMAAAAVAVALDLVRQKVPLGRDVIVALTAGEETGGSAGVGWLIQHHRELIDAGVALNEGGGLTLSTEDQNLIAVQIGVAEKTFVSYRLSVEGRGGHSSLPPTRGDPVVALARALVRIGEHRFPARVLPVVKDSLSFHAKTQSGALAASLLHAVATAPSVAPEDERVLAEDAFFNAQIRTTCVTTMLQAAPQDNVLPTSAVATVNCRVLPDETLKEVQSTLATVIGDPNVKIEVAQAPGSAPASALDGEASLAVRKAAAKLWGKDVPVLHSMTTGASDSRFLRGAGIPSYGISCAPLSLEDSKKGYGAHGADERRAVRWLGPGVRFLRETTAHLVAR